MLEIKYSNQALKFLKNIDSISQQRILNEVKQLSNEPFPRKVKRVEGSKLKLFRVRVGDYRILYEVDYNDNLLGVVKIDKRSRVYD
jgi:mRNA interferase RelE/StbE